MCFFTETTFTFKTVEWQAQSKQKTYYIDFTNGTEQSSIMLSEYALLYESLMFSYMCLSKSRYSLSREQIWSLFVRKAVESNHTACGWFVLALCLMIIIWSGMKTPKTLLICCARGRLLEERCINQVDTKTTACLNVTACSWSGYLNYSFLKMLLVAIFLLFF